MGSLIYCFAIQSPNCLRLHSSKLTSIRARWQRLAFEDAASHFAPSTRIIGKRSLKCVWAMLQPKLGVKGKTCHLTGVQVTLTKQTTRRSHVSPVSGAVHSCTCITLTRYHIKSALNFISSVCVCLSLFLFFLCQ